MGKRMGERRWKTETVVFLFFLILFLVSAVIRSLLAVFPKRAAFLDDEILMLELAQNIGRGGVLEVFHVPLNYSKILYPLLLAPFYGIREAAARMDAMAVFNAVLISSSLIPAYLLAKKLLSSAWKIGAALLLLAVSPVMSYSSTFLAENLYLPLLLWGFWFAAAGAEGSEGNPRTLQWSVLTGLCCFLLYMTKEAGAALFFAVLVWKIREMVSAAPDRRGRLGMSLAVFFACAVVPTLLIRGLLYGFQGYPYLANLFPETFDSAAYAVFLLLSALCLLLLFLLSGLFYPVLLPLSRRAGLPAERRTLLGIAGIYLIAAILGTAWGISAAQLTYKLETMATSMRYLCGALYPFLLLYLAETEREETESRTVRWLAGITALLAAVFLFLPKRTGTAELPGIQGLWAVLSGTDGADWWMKGIAVVLLLIPVFLKREWRQRFYLLMLPLLLAFEVFNGVSLAGEMRREQEVTDKALLAEIDLLDRTLDGLEGNTLVICPDGTDERMTAVHARLNDNYYLIDSYDFRQLWREAWPEYVMEVHTTDFPSPMKTFRTAETYIPGRVHQIVCFDWSIQFPDENLNVLTPAGMTIARVLQSRDPTIICLMNPLNYEPGTEIRFIGKNEQSVYIMVSGFATPEDWFTWTAEEEAVVRLRPNVPAQTPLRADWTIAVTNGTQTCRIYAGEELVYEGPAEPGTVSFDIPGTGWDTTGYLTLRFVFPDAKEPGNGDHRKLGAAFQSLTISAAE